MILAVVFIEALFMLLGLAFIAKPGSFIKFTAWQNKAVWAADFKATKKTEARMRVMGVFFLLIGALVMYLHLTVG